MNINKLIIDTLKPLNIPTAFVKYTGSATTYITFVEYLQQGQDFSEDDEEMTGHYVQLNVFSKGNYNIIVEQIKELLSAEGFKRLNEYDLYESDTGYYNHVIRFFYLED